MPFDEVNCVDENPAFLQTFFENVRHSPRRYPREKLSGLGNSTSGGTSKYAQLTAGQPRERRGLKKGVAGKSGQQKTASRECENGPN
jgi:hypothetical protein